MKETMISDMSRMLRQRILDLRSEQGNWRGQLSSSAISTAVAMTALHLSDADKYHAVVQRAAQWLKNTMKADGTWGDSVESPSNMTATLLSYIALYAVGEAPAKARDYLSTRFGGLSDECISKGVLNYYGKDLTFSTPILMMCALTGVISGWEQIPQLPFELSVLPQRLFRFLRLPVVSYAIPALIAVGILRYRKTSKRLLSRMREWFVAPSLRVMQRMQPVDGGFLEAAPLTGFVALCMKGAGFGNHPVTVKCEQFLVDTVRADGSWPIDTDLSNWVTTLCVKALGRETPERDRLEKQIRSHASVTKHPYTGAAPGGWGWSDLSGSVPDGDDTSGALVALHILRDGKSCKEIENGIRWLLDLQNSDGGMPTFCKGWGVLPFDRSSADISAHALLAFELWEDQLPLSLRKRCHEGSLQLIRWMVNAQDANGSWTPLWFGDQDAKDEHSPVYGTATVVDYLSSSSNSAAQMIAGKGVDYLLSAQNEDGGWGGSKGVSSKSILTARALSALASFHGNEKAVDRGVDFLHAKYSVGTLLEAEPIGLYFSRLWYSEELYSATFILQALNKIENKRLVLSSDASSRQRM